MRIKLLNECEADIETPDYDYRTVAHLAAAEKHYLVLEYLLWFSSFNFQLKDRWGQTPLDEIKD